MAIAIFLSHNIMAKDDLIFTATYNKNFFKDQSVDMFGLNLELFVSKRVSLNYSLMLGSDGRNLAFHTPAGVIGGISLFSFMLEDDLFNDEDPDEYIYASSIILMFLPEGINVHLPLSEYVSLVPFVNPLGYDYFANEKTYSSTFGLKIMYNLNDKLVIIPQAAVSLFYSSENHTCFSLGLSVGFKL